MIWCEDSSKKQLSGRNRLELQPAETLVIWNIPPGRSELQEALARVQPATVILFAVDPGLDQPQEFLKYLGGLIKYAVLNQSGRASIDQLAAAMAHRTSTVMAGIEWLSAKGQLSFIRENNGIFIFQFETSADPAQVSIIESRLRLILRETSAYRSFFRRTQADDLL
jgi:hypothetical protein